MLDMHRSQVVTDIVHSTIAYSGIEHAIISTPIYNRLHRVLQSSLVFLTYPSNKVKRFEHSLGVMHLAGEIFFNSICNASEDDLEDFWKLVSEELVNWRTNLNFQTYSFVKPELRNKYKQRGILTAPVPESNFYNKYCPKNIKQEQLFSYYVVFQAVRIAGLLHDVGHLPYSHILEHALKKMHTTVKSKTDKNSAEDLFVSTMERFAEGDDEIHEEIGKLLVGNIRSCIIDNIVNTRDPNLYFFLASFDFAEKIVSSKAMDKNLFAMLHLITAGVLDADRLDYCVRDALCSGTNSAIFSYNRLLANYSLQKITDDGVTQFYFCPSVKCIMAIEEILKRRKDIFSEINYHHRVHKHESLLEEVISAIGLEELAQMNEVDELPHTLPLSISSIWKLTSKLENSNDWPEYQIIQLDDSWLDTLLKHTFFERYGAEYLAISQNGNDILWNRFDELISTTKRYCSLFKRAGDFREFDILFFNELKSRTDELPKFCSEKLPVLKLYNEFYDSYHSFVFNYCIEKILYADTYKERFFAMFEEKINILTKEQNLNINDCLLRSSLFSLGYNTAKTPLYLHREGKNTIRIEQFTSQFESFQKERAISPIFHLYYLSKYDVEHSAYRDIDKMQLLEILAKAAVEVLIN